MKHRITFLLTLALLASVAFVSPAQAAFSKVGTTGAAFLKIGVGRSTAMGDAFVAIADDASASYFNPAGLARVSRQVQLNHVDWIADVNHENLAVVLPMTNLGTIAFTVTALTMGDIEQTTIDNPNTVTPRGRRHRPLLRRIGHGVRGQLRPRHHRQAQLRRHGQGRDADHLGHVRLGCRLRPRPLLQHRLQVAPHRRRGHQLRHPAHLHRTAARLQLLLAQTRARAGCRAPTRPRRWGCRRRSASASPTTSSRP